MKILLVGNYLLDDQESMHRFAKLLQNGLLSQGHDVHLINARPCLNAITALPRPLKKWAGYIDKFVLFTGELKKAAQWADIVHICDHGNSLYLNVVRSSPHVITCHDLLAARAALGEDTGCAPSILGKILQKSILKHLSGASTIVCDSLYTKNDVKRLISKDSQARLEVVCLGLNYDYHQLSAAVSGRHLAQIKALDASKPFLLSVGSDEPRKNRAAILRIFARLNSTFQGTLVIAGQALNDRLRELARQLGISSHVIEIIKPDNFLLRALYCRAFALIFPSLSEGFGWPLVEAQACGCPVVCSDQGSLPEIAGNGAIIKNVADEDGFAEAVLSLKEPKVKDALIEAGLRNVLRFDANRMVRSYTEIYSSLLHQDTNSR